MAKPSKSKTMAAVHETMRDLHDVGAIDVARLREFDALCNSPQKQGQPALIFAVFKDACGEWRWTLRSESGEILAQAAHGYRLKRKCLEAIALVRGASHAAIVA